MNNETNPIIESLNVEDTLTPKEQQMIDKVTEIIATKVKNNPMIHLIFMKFPSAVKMLEHIPYFLVVLIRDKKAKQLLEESGLFDESAK